jgi:hypothetical protein
VTDVFLTRTSRSHTGFSTETVRRLDYLAVRLEKVRAIPDVHFSLEITGQTDLAEKVLAILRDT